MQRGPGVLAHACVVNNCVCVCGCVCACIGAGSGGGRPPPQSKKWGGKRVFAPPKTKKKEKRGKEKMQYIS